MFDWLAGTPNELPVWGQLLLDIFKVLLGFGTVLLITRWTLARADRKDIIARQASALDAFSASRINSLNKAVAALSRIVLELNKTFGALAAQIDPLEMSHICAEFEARIEQHIDDLTLALEDYGGPPGSLPSDYQSAGEALVDWLKAFYEHQKGTISVVRVAAMIGMCSDLQEQLRWLGLYELNMRLQVGLNPASIWSPSFGAVLESASLEFFTIDPPGADGASARVIGTIVEQDDKETKDGKLATRRVIILGSDRVREAPE